MAPKTNKNGQIQTTKQNPKAHLVSMIKKMGPEITRALPRHVTADRMARIVLTAIRTTPKLTECSQESFLGSVMQCAQLGLEPNTPLGHAYLIPFWNKHLSTYECTLITGYQGMIDLAMRSGRVSSIFAHAVREGDEFSYRLGLDPTVAHVPSSDGDREKMPITHVYAVARIKDADPVFVVLSKAQIDARKNRSQSAKKSFSPWQSDYEAMALKTAVRALFKWMPKSSEIARVDAIETTAELGKEHLTAFDPEISDVLEKHGLLTEHTETVDGEVEETFDPETGEVL